MRIPKGRWSRLGAGLALIGGTLLLGRAPLVSWLARRAHPYIVLVSIDTLHVDWTGPYNPSVRCTPNLDYFARHGVLFRHAYTRVPITLPAHAAILSGTWLFERGVMANGDLVPASVTTLPELLRGAGYRTAAFVSLGVLGRDFGLDQGFDIYGDEFPEEKARWYRTADEVFHQVESWLTRSPVDPFFLWIHLSDPHEPYVPVGAPPDTRLSMDGRRLGEWNLARRELVTFPLELPPGRHRLRWTSLRDPHPDDRPETGIRLFLYRTESLREFASTPSERPVEEVDLRPDWSFDLTNDGNEPAGVELRFGGELVRPAPSDVLENYRTEVQYVDRYLGELRDLFGSLGIEDELLWILVSDHGEGLFRHDLLGHARYAFEDQLRVLWIFSGPGFPQGKTVEEAPALLSDVAPSLLEGIGLPVPAEMEGDSLAGCWQEGRCRQEREWWAYGFDAEGNRITSIAGYHWPYKWLWRQGQGKRAHRLLDDPWEERDLLGGNGSPSPEISDLANEFPRARRQLTELLRRRVLSKESEERLEILKSLGYLGEEASPGEHR